MTETTKPLDDIPDNLMDIIVEEGLKKGIKVRVTDTHPREIKAYHVFQVVASYDCKKAHGTFNSIVKKEERGKLSTHLASARIHQFSGPGEHFIPVLTQDLLIELIMLLPGTTELAKRLQNICRTAIRSTEFMANETKNINILVSLTRAIDFVELQKHAMNRCYIVYIGQIIINGKLRHVFKYGRTEKIDDRLATHANTFDGIEPICVVCAKSGVALEHAFKSWLESNELKLSLEINDKKQVELFYTTIDFPIQKIYHKFNQLAALGVPHDTLEIIVEMQAKQLESQTKQIDQLLTQLNV